LWTWCTSIHARTAAIKFNIFIGWCRTRSTNIIYCNALIVAYASVIYFNLIYCTGCLWKSSIDSSTFFGNWVIFFWGRTLIATTWNHLVSYFTLALRYIIKTVGRTYWITFVEITQYKSRLAFTIAFIVSKTIKWTNDSALAIYHLISRRTVTNWSLILWIYYPLTVGWTNLKA